MQGGILRAEQVLALNNLNWILEERQTLFERIRECKLSLEKEKHLSISRKFLANNAPTMLSAAESILQKLSSRLSLAIQLTADDSKD